ncbi:hypothetical protein DAT35_10170 [Vitiosangium sp. GDMCC 1.1324]|nr:hypothetical protein DAT35_10170 [Vitiosangium sp. GDMCC 1.1324]
MLGPRGLVVLLGLVLGMAACGIKGSPRPPESSPRSTSEAQPPGESPSGPLSPPTPPPDAGTP